MTLSRKDRRFPDRAGLLDGLSVKLDDTDRDPDADVDIYLNGSKIKHFKDWPPGRVRRVRGRSGLEYDLVLLLVRHKRATIQLGIAHKD